MSLKHFRVGKGSIEGKKKPIIAQDFKSLKRKACEEWGLVSNERVQIYDEADTEVNDEYFGILEDGSLLYLEIEKSDEDDSRRTGHQFNANHSQHAIMIGGDVKGGVIGNQNSSSVENASASAAENAMVFSHVKSKNIAVNQGNRPLS